MKVLERFAGDFLWNSFEITTVLFYFQTFCEAVLFRSFEDDSPDLEQFCLGKDRWEKHH